MKNDNRFWGYRAAIGCMIVLFMHLGTQSTVGLMLPQISKGLGCPASDVAIMSSFAMAAAAVCSGLAPRLIPRLTPRRAMICSSVICAAAFIISARAVSLMEMYLVGILSGLVFGFGMQACIHIVIGSWFVEKRAVVSTAVFGGAALGNTFWSLVVGQLSTRFGYRTTYMVMAGAVLCTVIPAVLYFIRDPGQMGQQPLGNSGSSPNHPSMSGVTLEEASRMPVYWIFITGMVLSGTLMIAFNTYMPTYWQTVGEMQPLASSRYISFYTVLSAISAMVSGRVAERMGGRFFIIYMHVSFIVSMMAAVFLIRSGVSSVVLTVVFAALAYPTFSCIPSIIAGPAFGNKDYGRIAARLTVGTFVGRAALPVVMKWILSVTDSLAAGFLWCAAGAGAAATLFLIGFSVCRKNQSRQRINSA